MEKVMTISALELAQKNMQAYFETHDVQYIAEDAVFINKSTGERIVGRQAIGQALEYFYHIAFDAHAEVSHSIVTEDQAMVEGLFIGKHIGDFQGMSATGKTISVPLCVTYTLENGLIKEGRIYMMADVLRQQLGN